MGLRISIGGQDKEEGFTAEQVIRKLREAKVLLSQGSTVDELSRKLSVTEQTRYR